MTSLDVELTIQKAIARYIDPQEAFIFLFGSRALGRHRVGSDYDIGVYTGRKIPWATIGKIRGEIEESRVPVDVDIVDFSTVSDEFKAASLHGVKIWNRPKTNLKLI